MDMEQCESQVASQREGRKDCEYCTMMEAKIVNFR
jgi:hypothetical protein